MFEQDESLAGSEGIGRDLVKEARRGRLTPVKFRATEIGGTMRYLEQGRSVLFVGAPGVGKTAVVHGVAQAMNAAGKGGLVQLSTADLLSGTRYLGEWQTKVDFLLGIAAKKKKVLYFTDFLNLPSVGKTVQDKASVLDAIHPRVAAKEVSLVAETTPDMLSALDRTPELSELFERITIKPLTPTQVEEVLRREAGRVEVRIDAAGLRALVDVTTRFGSDKAQPGPALQLLRQVRDYQEQKASVGEPEPVTPKFIEKVFAIYSGLPKFVVSRREKVSAADMRRRLQDRIVGQRDAIDAVVEAITIFKAGLHDPDRPIGAFLFVGPTGVGKTEVARSLAALLFGSEHRMLRFDLSEFKDYNSFELLIGNPTFPDRGARLIDPVRSQPFQVLLFDEIEKAHRNILDLFLQLLDEGRLTPPGGQPVNFRNTIVIATSNVGAEHTPRALGFEQRDVQASYQASIRKELELEFRPEFINRFQHIVVFHPLSRGHLRAIARHELNRIMQREGIVGRQLVLDVDDAALDVAIDRGFDPRYGARALKREIQRQLVLPIAAVLTERSLDPHTIVRVVAKDGEIRVRAIQTEESVAARRAQEPVEVPGGRRLAKPEIDEAIGEVRERIAALAEEVGVRTLHEEVRRLSERRAQPGFWRDSAAASRAMRDLDRASRVLQRLERLRDWVGELEEGMARANTRSDVEQTGLRLLRLEDAVSAAHRELVLMPDDAYWDALVDVRVIGPGNARARDFLVSVYLDWARSRRMEIEWICDPLHPSETSAFAVKGHYAFGYLALESGLHRVRDDNLAAVVKVRAGPWLDARGMPQIVGQRALKSVGASGERVRSRILCDGGLVLQNGKTIGENRDFAAEVEPSWNACPPGADEIVRRYDLEPFLVRDTTTGWSSGSRNALGPKQFHSLLCSRIEAVPRRV